MEEWPDGEKYFGNYAKGVREGQGLYRWPDGDMYEGMHVNNLAEGHGVC